MNSTRAISWSCAALLALAACTSNDDILATSAQLRIDGEPLTVGTVFTVRPVREDGSTPRDEVDLLPLITAEPPGVVELVEPGTFRGIGAGNVTFVLRARGYAVERAASISCPSLSSTVVSHTGTIGSDETWTAEAGIHRVTGTLSVAGATLTIGACAQVQLDAGALIDVGGAAPGRLVTRGTRENPITMSRSPAAASAYAGIRIHAIQAGGSEVRWLTVVGAGGVTPSDGDSERPAIEIIGDGLIEDQPSVIIQGLVVRDCADVGLRVRSLHVMSALTWVDNAVKGCGGAPLSYDAGSLGALPLGDFTGNGRPNVRVTGGWAGPNNQYWRALGIPLEVETSIIIEPRAGPTGPNLPQYGGLRYIVEAGSVLKFRSGAGIYVGRDPARVVDPANPLARIRFFSFGSLDKPVRFTSAAATPAPGDWVGIAYMENARTRLRELSESGGSRGFDYAGQLRHSIVEYAGAPSGILDGGGVPRRGGVILLGEAPLNQSVPWVFEGCLFRNNAGFGVVSAVSQFTTSQAYTLARRNGMRSCLCANELGPFSIPAGSTNTVETSSPCPCSGVRVWAE